MLFREHRQRLVRRWRRVDARAVATSLVLMPATTALLPRLGFGRTRSVYDKLSELGHRGAALTDPHKLVHSIDVVAMRFAPERTCLARALVIEFLLRRAGFAPDVHIGVRKEGQEMRAHAWVELDNEVLGRLDSRYESMGAVSPFSTASPYNGETS